MHITLRRIVAIFKKNFKKSLSNKKKMLSHFFVPSLICLLYYFYRRQLAQKQRVQKQQSGNMVDLAMYNIISVVLKTLVTIQIGLINGSTIRQTITLFINQRQDQHRQYQFVMGLCKRWHTLSNMLYMMVQESVYLLPFFILLNTYEFNLLYVFNFAAFIISSNFLTIALTSFFTQHKVATEVIGIVFSIASFLPLMYNPQVHDYKYYLATFLPNSSFAIAILSNDQTERFRISLSSLVLWKFYLLIYYMVEFRNDFIDTWNNIKQKCKKFFSSRNHQDAQILINQQIQSSSVLSKQLTQNDDIKMGSVAIEMINVEKRFGKVAAVNGVSLKILKSEILGLLGRNGAGKTTIVDMITKVTRPSAGTIKFNKNKVNDKEIQLQKGICYQHEILYEDLSTIDHLRFYCQIKGVQNPQEQIQKIVQKVGIQGQLDKKVKQLSGGTKRKLSFCIALLNSPDILIFDQPTSGLDPASRRNIWQILQHLRSADRSIILTTHHLDQADYLSDRISIIKKGKIIQQGTPSEIKQRHGKGYYLTIYQYTSQQQSKNSKIPFEVKLCTKIITQCLKNTKVIDKSSDSIKYFINKSNSYQQLTKCIQTLEKLDGVKIALETNNLEQSFIAINIDDDQNQLQQADRQQQPMQGQLQLQQIVYYSAIKQIFGIVLKNFYCFLHKYHYFYNLNIIILVFITLVNSLFIQKLSQKVDLGMSQQEKQKQAKANPLFLLQGYILMSSAFLAVPVLQKQQKIIKLLRTRGVRKLNYWIGHFIFDFGYFWVNYLILRLMFNDLIKTIPLFLMAFTACGIILYSYTFSMLFNKVKTANAWFSIINTLMWLVMMPLLMPQQILSTTFYRHLVFLKYLFPFFDINYHLLKNLQIIQQMQMFKKLTGGGEGVKLQDKYTVHITTFIYLVIFIVLQSSIMKRLIKREKDEHISEQIKLQNVTKKYKNTQALKNVSYKIDNQSLALLGHNGAGKSTTFGLLSSQLQATQGKVYLQKHLKRSHEDVMVSAGICYQEDTLWKFMTPSKILNIFCYILGVSDKQKQQDWLYDNLDIQPELKHRKFDNLSGGNKRKICMAVCLIGSPKIKLLDQCSTGLDPVSRLSMVNTLKKQNIGGSIVFTTHSIPQAQQICSRAIVMKKGEVSQDNRIHRLKQKYYPYYWIQILVKEQSSLQQLSQKILKGAVNSYNYRVDNKKKRIQIQKQSIRLSQLMKILQKSKQKGIINDFNVDQPKLQDVYLLLTADQNQNGQNQNQSSQNQMNQNPIREVNSVVFVNTNVNEEHKQIEMRQI